MKKSAIFVLLSITLIFTAFVAGLYIGRHDQQPSVQVDSIITPTATPAATTAPQSSAPHPSSAAVQGAININTATLQELDTLPGIGPSLAQAILDYRAEYGPFTTPEDLLQVSGIGEKKLEAILEFITVGG